MSAPELGPDPRPQLIGDPEPPLVKGWRCMKCRHPLALPAPWCPICRGPLEDAAWGPSGLVWSSTVLRVPVSGRTPPLVLAYVDLDDGPRVLGHIATESSVRLPVGTDVTLTGRSVEGDLLFTAV